ncbi:MAG TPA: protoheme IX farnesyltransferase [Flavobacteriia bacterium]|jgi:protoheme IX farnesyltransferase|nr:protoheme IX farnesyltransferase [Flavobacteriia bacterium]
MQTLLNTTTKNQTITAVIDDLKQLTKFGLSISVVFSAIAGYLLAADTIRIATLLLLAIGGYFMVGASNVFNQIIEKDTDKLMKRTKNRPLPAGRMSVNTALAIGIVCALLGIVILYIINPKTAMFGAISIVLYVSVYTPLKPVTPFAVFMGALPGAIPFMLGWVAATGKFAIEPGILFLIQFFWQFPHFWAIAWLQYDQYKKAGFNLLPTREKNKKASTQILLYTIWMILVSIFPVTKLTGSLYLSPIAAIIIFIVGLVMLYYGFELHKKQTDKIARKLMLASVLYITSIQVIYVVDKFLH